MNIKAIETVYNGYRFRSRLEARWAVFFEELGLHWQYEVEGFELPSGARYLPDFKIDIDGSPLWIEIKPGVEQSEKLDELIACSPGTRGTVFNDIPSSNGITPHSWYEDGPFRYSDRPFCRWGGGGWDNFYIFCVKPCCGKVGFQFNGRSERIECECIPEKQEKEGERFASNYPGYRGFGNGKGYTGDHSRIVRAFDKARQARFEHGQSGAS